MESAELDDVLIRDRQRIERRLDACRRIREPGRREAALAEIALETARARDRLAARRSGVPAVSYPPELPISQARDRIAAAIQDHQVVVVAGETGSGKTTQLPKICLELGRGVRGLIGHTQPRRIAARTVAERIAEELAVPLGDAVGYQVRFTDQVSEATYLKLMTDGILLAEIQRDRLLLRYDTIIIDEAHERSLNIDFILGYLQQLLPRRPDLKVVVTSATIDPQRFAAHFGGAPIIEVSGRTYPVEIRYRPLVQPADSEDDDDAPAVPAPSLARGTPVANPPQRGAPVPRGSRDSTPQDTLRDQAQAICDAVTELCQEGPGDILVFLSGEREIRDTADALADTVPRHTEILPLFARLSAAEQHRVFAPHPGRRVVLATNVAETSLTVPGIRYVVDPGTARVSRYSHRTKVQRLPIEPVSQASANQRAGRCGRVDDGICIRLYSEQDFLARPEFTEPEILRTNLASVILQMTAIGLGDLAAFPFVDPPDRRSVNDGVQLLEELGALVTAAPGGTDGRAAASRLTPLGARLAQLPVDPRLGRMILEADRNGCVREVMIITAALSIQDPRERPIERRQAADELHRRFADESSDFLTYLNLWNYLKEQQRDASSSAFRRLCKREFLNHLRIREWQDLVAQLRQLARQVGISANPEPAAPQQIHIALLAGLLSHIGYRESDRSEFAAARGATFAIWPGSALARRPPHWAMAGELVETSRLWGREVARIEPEWIEPLAGHLVKRSYSEPHWAARRGSVVAYEKVTLYGLPIVSQRAVGYGRIDPELSRELFIRNALIEGDWRTHHRFFAENRALLEDVEDLENRTRRRDILVDDETLFAFYDGRIPDDVVSGAHFDRWWKAARRADPDLLSYTTSLLVAGTGPIDPGDYPDVWPIPGGELALSYQFEPGTAADGVTVHVPVQLLPQLDPEPFSWQIPGLREELVTALIRSLPKAIRTAFVPAPDTARAVLAELAVLAEPAERSLLEVLGEALGRRGGFVVPSTAWQLDSVPDHLRITFRIEDATGAVLTVKDASGSTRVAEGKDLEALKALLQPRVRAAVAAIAGAGIERSGLTTWDVGALPRRVEREVGGRTVAAYPAIVDEDGHPAVRVLPSPAEQSRAMQAGTRRLLLQDLGGPLARVHGQVDHVLTTPERLSLAVNPYPSTTALLEDCLACAVDALVVELGGPAWDGEAYATLLSGVRDRLDPAVLEVLRSVAAVLATARDLERQLSSTRSLPLLPALADLRDQLNGLVYNGFIGDTGRRRLPDLIRYLRGMLRRLEKAPENVNADRDRMDRVHLAQQQFEVVRESLPPGRRDAAEVTEVRWMLEELRVSFFAQPLGTAYPVSEQRIQRALAGLRK